MGLNEGINELWTLACSASGTKYDSTNARVGVGNGTTPADASQGGLQGASTAFAAMDGGYPTYGTSQQAVFQGTFGDAAANFAWEEFTVDNGATANKNLLRKVQNKGTKNGGTWVLRITATIS